MIKKYKIQIQILTYIQGTPQKQQLIASLVEQFKGKP